MALCVGCSGTSGFRGGLVRPRVSPWLLFRRGAAFLLLVVCVAAGLALERHGWPGVWRVFLTLIHPGMLLGLVPLALVVGGLIALVRKALFGRF